MPIELQYVDFFFSIVGTAASIAAVATIFYIKKYYLGQLRFPEINADLTKELSAYRNAYHRWDTDPNSPLISLSAIKAILENLKTHRGTPIYVQNQISIVLKKIQPNKWLIVRREISSLSKEECWDIFLALNHLNTSLAQHQKDSEKKLRR